MTSGWYRRDGLGGANTSCSRSIFVVSSVVGTSICREFFDGRMRAAGRATFFVFMFPCYLFLRVVERSFASWTGGQRRTTTKIEPTCHHDQRTAALDT